MFVVCRCSALLLHIVDVCCCLLSLSLSLVCVVVCCFRVVMCADRCCCCLLLMALLYAVVCNCCCVFLFIGVCRRFLLSCIAVGRCVRDLPLPLAVVCWFCSMATLCAAVCCWRLVLLYVCRCWCSLLVLFGWRFCLAVVVCRPGSRCLWLAVACAVATFFLCFMCVIYVLCFVVVCAVVRSGCCL